jgi:hypothetical protein
MIAAAAGQPGLVMVHDSSQTSLAEAFFVAGTLAAGAGMGQRRHGAAIKEIVAKSRRNGALRHGHI